MDENNQDGSEVLETTEAETEAVENTEDVLSADEIAELKAKAAKADELEAKNKQLYERAKKAETKEVPQEGTLSPADLLAVMKADVHEDDMERVERFAKMEGISIREALKSDELKAILSIRAEQRATAAGANVSNVRRGPTKISDEVLLDKAAKGDLPDSDAEIERLIAAKAKQR